ncbi:cytochrome P460 family protein [Myxococcota bacterium]|nr:cytochrome P460 family protein [Myxococcota bacterium]
MTLHGWTMPGRALLPLVLLALPGCGPEGDGDPADDETLAAELWAAIADYDGWGTPAGWEGPFQSAHMDQWVGVYFDDALAGWDGTGAAPEDAIAVKEAYTDETGATIAGLTVMQKIAGYDPDGGDWFYAEYAPDGTVSAAGKVDMCIGCHEGASTDFLFSVQPPS